MKYFYGQYDGEEFPTQDQLFGFDQLMQFILQYGDQALKAIEQMLKDSKDPEQSALLEQFLKEGMLDKDGKGKLQLTPKAVGRMQRRASMKSSPTCAPASAKDMKKSLPASAANASKAPSPTNLAIPSANSTSIKLCITPYPAMAFPTPINTMASLSQATPRFGLMKRISSFIFMKAPPVAPPSSSWT